MGGVQVTLSVPSGNVDNDLLGVYLLNPQTNKWEYVGGMFNAESDKLEGYADHANISSWAVSGVNKAIWNLLNSK